MTIFPPRLEWVHIRLSIILPRKLIDAFSHLLEEDRDEDRHYNQIKDAHRRATTKVEELDRNQIVHNAEELGARTRAATRQGKGQAKRFQPLNHSQQDCHGQNWPSQGESDMPQDLPMTRGFQDCRVIDFIRYGP